ncbi:DUF4189 domain-containing protein [Cardiobacterium valvarum]|uniref:DUF4189 domain-containing protein n=1 Tax=Cardiobacterium valvarum TaxID=194702 RepID=A0A381EBI4_9GAMM|nr:DUF4189 domain-containing protein [Cardiobacterium valvarum]SUX24356.1 Uncharacterised protein [Cardiobacterium valvarum]
MKQTMMNTAAGVLAALLLGSAGLAWADGFDPWLADGLNKQIQQNREAQQQPTYSGPTAAEIRAWEQREAEVQAEIAELHRTPFYMAVAYDIPNRRVVAAGGYRTEARAVEETMRQCGRGRSCHLVATFANTCAMFAYPDGGPNGPSDFFVGKDHNGQQAIVQAVRACEAVHGHNQCSYADVQTTRTGDTFCTGYDYSVYGQD